MPDPTRPGPRVKFPHPNLLLENLRRMNPQPISFRCGFLPNSSISGTISAKPDASSTAPRADREDGKDNSQDDHRLPPPFGISLVSGAALPESNPSDEVYHVPLVPSPFPPLSYTPVDSTARPLKVNRHIPCEFDWDYPDCSDLFEPSLTIDQIIDGCWRDPPWPAGESLENPVKRTTYYFRIWQLGF
jgi:hypothetical protein